MSTKEQLDERLKSALIGNTLASAVNRGEMAASCTDACHAAQKKPE
ncbi:MAG: hypothetical protein ACI3UZ_06285 [Oscillospiraceae bacterium]|nr:hypothetical protein [Oscillospiraceae bacterium]